MFGRARARVSTGVAADAKRLPALTPNGGGRIVFSRGAVTTPPSNRGRCRYMSSSPPGFSLSTVPLSRRRPPRRAPPESRPRPTHRPNRSSHCRVKHPTPRLLRVASRLDKVKSIFDRESTFPHLRPRLWRTLGPSTPRASRTSSPGRPARPAPPSTPSRRCAANRLAIPAPSPRSSSPTVV